MTIAENLRSVHERIARAAEKAKRDPNEISLVAVAKTFPTDAIREAYAAGQRLFGENYVQELSTKAEELSALSDLRWHFIGHLQRNKVKPVLATRAVIETVDSAKLAVELGARASETVEVLVQVNVGGEAQKSGCEPDVLPEVIAAVREQKRLSLRGLMTIPPQASQPSFRKLRELAQEHGLRELSMGMSADLEVAIEEGATIVRVGTAIFGIRSM